MELDLSHKQNIFDDIRLPHAWISYQTRRLLYFGGDEAQFCPCVWWYLRVCDGVHVSRSLCLWWWARVFLFVCMMAVYVYVHVLCMVVSVPLCLCTIVPRVYTLELVFECMISVCMILRAHMTVLVCARCRHEYPYDKCTKLCIGSQKTKHRDLFFYVQGFFGKSRGLPWVRPLVEWM